MKKDKTKTQHRKAGKIMNWYSTILFYIDKLRFYFLPRYIKIVATHDYKIFQELLHLIKPHIKNFKEAKILDVGCGVRAQYTLLFHSLEANVIGIDVDILTYGLRFEKYRRILTSQDPKRFFTRLITDFYQDKIYYRELKRLASFPLKFEDLDLREMDASQTSFKEEEFDLVVSNAVFEHLKNVGGVLTEMKRIMKQNALIYAEIHLFPSLTGGHNTLWSNPDTQRVVLGRVPPWDHLRKQKYSIDPSLNRLRESEYFRLFSENFEILKWITEYEEPECYLTQELISELNEYSVKELLKRSIVVIARKV